MEPLEGTIRRIIMQYDIKDWRVSGTALSLLTPEGEEFATFDISCIDMNLNYAFDKPIRFVLEVPYGQPR